MSPQRRQQMTQERATTRQQTSGKEETGESVEVTTKAGVRAGEAATNNVTTQMHPFSKGTAPK